MNSSFCHSSAFREISDKLEVILRKKIQRTRKFNKATFFVGWRFFVSLFIRARGFNILKIGNRQNSINNRHILAAI